MYNDNFPQSIYSMIRNLYRLKLIYILLKKLQYFLLIFYRFYISPSKIEYQIIIFNFTNVFKNTMDIYLNLKFKIQIP